ncbi:hypothetical protein WR25_05088 [Diploscapter pachys]|uniref:Uncharacterized protein n=1 Tax=Diploscapter pachys TaxID=2018661 RepID=A0A2A2KXR4_9BILA|nr:hypothetical protein WR25_05088 [Diploscapter pachys]
MKCKNSVDLLINLEGVGCKSFSNPNTAREIQCTTNNEWTIDYQGSQKKILGIFCKVTSDLCITQCPINPVSTPKDQPGSICPAPGYVGGEVEITPKTATATSCVKEMKCKNSVDLLINLEGVGCKSFSNPNTAREIQCTTNNDPEVFAQHQDTLVEK